MGPGTRLSTVGRPQRVERGPALHRGRWRVPAWSPMLMVMSVRWDQPIDPATRRACCRSQPASDGHTRAQLRGKALATHQPRSLRPRQAPEQTTAAAHRRSRRASTRATARSAAGPRRTGSARDGSTAATSGAPLAGAAQRRRPAAGSDHRPASRSAAHDSLPADIVEVDGLWVTTPVRTAYDGARLASSLTEATVFVDMMLAAGLVTIGELCGVRGPAPAGLEGCRSGARCLTLRGRAVGQSDGDQAADALDAPSAAATTAGERAGVQLARASWSRSSTCSTPMPARWRVRRRAASRARASTRGDNVRRRPSRISGWS